jgi:tRNA(Ile)-lysidine synthase
MISSLARRVRRAIRSGRLFEAGDRVAVAVSGGPDSVALLLLLRELAVRAEWSLAGITHVNHGLRPADADADAVFCQALAARLGLPCDVTTVDTRSQMAGARTSVEVAARVLRYRAFEEAADRLGATVVATGHTADDQAETVLMRLLTGASPRGVSAIRARRGRYRRPLLSVGRAELQQYLAERGETARDDVSNRDESIPRNRLRSLVMPAVRAFAPNAARALSRYAELAADDDSCLAEQAARAVAGAVQMAPNGVEVNRAALGVLPSAVARRVALAAIEQAGGRATLDGVRTVLAVARSKDAVGRRHLAGLTVEGRGEHVWLSRAIRVPDARPVIEARELPVPGAVTLDDRGTVLRARPLVGLLDPALRSSAGSAVAVQADRLVLPLSVRSRQPGDRFRPLGAPGARKLQDVLVDRKIPYSERDGVPIVVDGSCEIVWVAGVALAERARATAPERGVVILEIEKGRP